MKTTLKIFQILLFFTFFSLVLSILEANSCKCNPKISVAVGEIKATNMSVYEARVIKNFVQQEIEKYGNIKKNDSTTKVQKIVSGVIFRMNDVYVINLKVKNVKHGRTKEITKTSKDTSVYEAVKNAVSSIMH